MDRNREKTSTSSLWAQLFKAKSVRSYMDGNAGSLDLPTFSSYITGLCRQKGEVPEHIIRRAGLERSFGHQLFRGARNPSRDTVLQLAFGFSATVEETQELLLHAGQSQLYPRVRRDAAIGYCLKNGYGLVETQCMLSELGLPAIGGYAHG